MAQNMNATNNITSSPPSGGTATHHGTPSTIPTMVSPDAGNGCGRPGARIPPLSLVPNSTDPRDLASRRQRPVSPINTTREVEYLHVPASTIPPLDDPLGVFTVDGPSVRAFIVTGLQPKPGLYETIANAYRNFGSLVNIDASLLMSEGMFSVEFFDYRDAHRALRLTVQTLFYEQQFQCFKLLQKDIAKVHGLNPDTVSNHTAEYLLSVIDVGAQVFKFTVDSIIDACQTGVGPRFGDVKALQLMCPLPGATATYRIEWFDSRVNAILLSGVELQGYRLTIMPFTPDVNIRSGTGSLSGRFREQGRDRLNHLQSVETFLTPRLPKSPAAGAHNVVDVAKIHHGQDVRTTIMLRNIPNRVDQANLKRLLDESSLGQYDFMYLRIDFANNCNVGYAFINFVDPMAIIPFARARAGQKWNLFQSDKVAEISYATIQGRDCLIQKFRNSSVMLEQPAFRPKLYKTGNGPDAGTEEPFPQSDNHAKLKRSCDNAEHVGLYHPTTSSALVPIRGATQHIAPPRNQAVGGVYTVPAPNRSATTFNHSPTSLYAPREGQAYRERQRRQGSQYDRGTPGAEFERYYAIVDGRPCSIRTPTQPFSPHTIYSSDNLTLNFQGLNLN